MSLTHSSGPLSGQAPQTVNYRIEGPAHKLLMHEFPRRIRATFGGRTVFDTTRAMLLHETGLLPQVYVPLDDIRADLITPTDHHTFCPFKGTASYWTVTVARQGDDSQVAQNAIWAYPEPKEEVAAIRDHFCFYATDVVPDSPSETFSRSGDEFRAARRSTLTWTRLSPVSARRSRTTATATGHRSSWSAGP